MKQLRDAMFGVRHSTSVLLLAGAIGMLAAYEIPGSAARRVSDRSDRSDFHSSSAPAAPLPDTQEIAYDDGGVHAWWCSDKDSFGAAVRFTPSEYPCEVIAGRAPIHYMDGANIFLRIFAADGPGHYPGTLLEETPCPNVPHNADSSFKEYDLTSPVTVDSGDFYVCFWQKALFNLVSASDLTMDSVSRQFWFLPPQGWCTPYGMDAADQLIRALVYYPGTGIVEEIPHPQSVPRSLQFVIDPNPCRGEFNLRLLTGSLNPTSVAIRDASGRLVRSLAVSQSAIQSSRLMDLRDMPDGLYFVQLGTGAQTATAKLILQR
jgi:hypothetical protein